MQFCRPQMNAPLHPDHNRRQPTQLTHHSPKYRLGMPSTPISQISIRFRHSSAQGKPSSPPAELAHALPSTANTQIQPHHNTSETTHPLIPNAHKPSKRRREGSGAEFNTISLYMSNHPKSCTLNVFINHNPNSLIASKMFLSSATSRFPVTIAQTKSQKRKSYRPKLPYLKSPRAPKAYHLRLIRPCLSQPKECALENNSISKA